MTKTYCDICGAEILSSENAGKLVLKFAPRYCGGVSYNETFDTCAACARRIFPKMGTDDAVRKRLLWKGKSAQDG